MTSAAFWMRFTLTGIVVNIPLALALALGALPRPVAFVISAACGVLTLAVWDAIRVRRVDGEVSALDPALASMRALDDVPASPARARILQVAHSN